MRIRLCWLATCVSSDSDGESTDLQRDALLAAGIDLVTCLGFATMTMAYFARLIEGPR
ncbi:hypothetical protein Bra1253DRAFT_06044 [Bradyrhizobium sp. WSM1253]|nr:hypothetical protein Bra1253DRAFT_06044 [Bradyrhizobium sp. WSM1253]